MNTAFQRVLRCTACATLACWLVAGASAWSAVDFYAPDKEHLWNRLYAGLFVREGYGRVFDDLLDPPYTSETKHLLTGDSHAAALTLLREFTAAPAVLQKMTPLHRAMMQRDLIALAHWLARPDPTAEQQNLAKALAQAIRFVALSAEDIRRLPDNYARAVASSDAREFDEKQPARVFLPADILSDDGPWLSVEPSEKDDPLAGRSHFRSFTGRSMVDVRFRHAGGREAGEKYLKELAAISAGLAAGAKPEHPQFPVGTMWALVRRAILMDSQGNLVAAPLVESVELRFYRKIAQDFSGSQAAFELELSRRLLFGAGGFHRTEAVDSHFSPFFALLRNESAQDPFATKLYAKPGEPPLCISCHLQPGIMSVYSRTRTPGPSTSLPAKPELRAATSAHVAEVAVELAGKKEGWKLLRRLWDEK